MPLRPGARIYRPTPRNVARLAAALRRGELVGVPTETVYGLAANALDAKACRGIFRAKGRPTRDPLIVHIDSLAALETVAIANRPALALARRFWPGALTIVLPKTAAVPDIVTAGQPSVAVRLPSHPLFRNLLRLARIPLAAPSANPFGYVSPTSAKHVHDGLGRRIRHILDGGPSTIGLESTIVDLREPRRPRLLRPGAITRQQLESVLGRKLLSGSSRASGGAQLAPGMLKRHYSPRTPVVLHDRMPAKRSRGEAWVFLARPKERPAANEFWLDATGRLAHVAKNLFALLRDLDGRGFAKIHVERARGSGLAVAINDRLQRAAAR